MPGRSLLTASMSLSLVVVSGCVAEERADKKTNWLLSCDVDEDCDGELSCLCGACTRACDTASDCGDPAVSCLEGHAASVQVQCGAPFDGSDGASGMCQPDCDRDSDCGPSQKCALGSCAPVAAVEAADCSATDEWASANTDPEFELLELINAARSDGTLPCATMALPPLRFSQRLQCGARLHVLDMIAEDYNASMSPAGLTGDDWALAAGYDSNVWGVTISQSIGQSPEEVMATIEEQYGQGDPGLDRNCMNLVDSDYEDFGIGYSEGQFSVIFGTED